MKCPHCDSSPMSFGWFLIFGWIRIKCHHCDTRLMLRSMGERFWIVLAVGAVILAGIVVFLDYPFRWFGETGTTILFVVIIVSTLVLSMYVAWKDSRFDVLEHP